MHQGVQLYSNGRYIRSSQAQDIRLSESPISGLADGMTFNIRVANKADTLIFQVRWILQALSLGSSANTNLNWFIYSKLRIDYTCAQRKSYYIAVDWLMTSWRICARQWPLSVGSFVPIHSNLPVKPIYDSNNTRDNIITHPEPGSKVGIFTRIFM